MIDAETSRIQNILNGTVQFSEEYKLTDFLRDIEQCAPPFDCLIWGTDIREDFKKIGIFSTRGWVGKNLSYSPKTQV